MTTRIFLPPRPLSQYRQSGDRRNFAKIIFIKKTRGRVVYSTRLPHFQYQWRATKWDTNHRIACTSTSNWLPVVFFFDSESGEVHFGKRIKHEENSILNWIWCTLHYCFKNINTAWMVEFNNRNSTSKLKKKTITEITRVAPKQCVTKMSHVFVTWFWNPSECFQNFIYFHQISKLKCF